MGSIIMAPHGALAQEVQDTGEDIGTATGRPLTEATDQTSGRARALLPGVQDLGRRGKGTQQVGDAQLTPPQASTPGTGFGTVSPSLPPTKTPTGSTANQMLQVLTSLLLRAAPHPNLPHPQPNPAYPTDKLVNVQPLISMRLEDSDNEAVQKVPSLLQIPTLFILSFQVRLRWDEPHIAPPWPGLLTGIPNLEHP